MHPSDFSTSTFLKIQNVTKTYRIFNNFLPMVYGGYARVHVIISNLYMCPNHIWAMGSAGMHILALSNAIFQPYMWENIFRVVFRVVSRRYTQPCNPHNKTHILCPWVAWWTKSWSTYINRIFECLTTSMHDNVWAAYTSEFGGMPFFKVQNSRKSDFGRWPTFTMIW